MNNLQCGQAIHKAIVYATKAHKGQHRKGSDLDYLSHPMEVLQILAGMDSSMDLMMAGILHDVVEDTAVTAEELRAEFGDVVCDLVMGHTEDKTKSWKERKESNLKIIMASGRDQKVLVLADFLSNARSMYMDMQELGDQLWDRFNAPKSEQQWYMRNMLKMLKSLKMDTLTGRYYRELEQLYSGIFE